MKKKILIFVLMSTMLLVGCGSEQYTDEQGMSSDLIGGMFVVLNECKDTNMTGNYYSTYIVYDKNTKVMYYILDGYRRCGLCPIYDANGDIMVYGDDIND